MCTDVIIHICTLLYTNYSSIFPIIVAMVTIYEKIAPSDDCHYGYNIEIRRAYKGHLSVGQNMTLRIRPILKCREPDFGYGKDYLVGGRAAGNVLTVGEHGKVWGCAAYSRVLPQLKNC